MSLLLLFGGTDVGGASPTLQVELDSTAIGVDERFQYQIKAEPPFVASFPVVVFLDKYYQVPNQPKQFPKYLVPEGHFSVDPRQLTQVERSTVDKYWQQPNQPKMVRRELVAEGHFSKDAQAEFPINLDKWFKETERSPNVYKPLVKTGISIIDPVQLTQAERSSIDKYYQVSYRPFGKARLATLDMLAAPAYQQQQEIVTIDKHYQLPNQPRMVPRQLVREGHTQAFTEFTVRYAVGTKTSIYLPLRDPLITGQQSTFPTYPFSQPDVIAVVTNDLHLRYLTKFQYQGKAAPFFTGETSTVDKWFRNIFEPMPLAKILPRSGISVTDPHELLVPLDRWFRLTGTPPDRVRPLVREGLFVIDPRQLTQAENSTLDKWYRETARTLWTKKPLVPEGFFAKDLVSRGETITVDKWFKETEKTIWQRMPLVREGAFTIDPRQLTQAERSTVDKYWQQLTEPVRSKPALVREGLSIFDVRQFVARLDGWYRNTETPVRTSAQLLKQGISAFDLKEFRVDLDRWYRETQTPPKTAKPLVKEGYTIDPYQLIQAERSTIDKYWQQLSEPRRSKSELVKEGVSGFDPKQFRIDVDKFVYQQEYKRIQKQLTPYVNEFIDAKDISFVVGQDGTFYLDFNKARPSLRDTSVYPPYQQQQEIVTVDKWWGPLSEPRRSVLPLVRESQSQVLPRFIVSFVVGTKTSLYLPIRELPQYDHSVSPFRYEDTSAFSDRWFKETETPPKKAAPRLPGWFTIDPRQLTQAERITLDKYWRQLAEPRRFPPQLVREGASVFDAKQFRIDLDKYWQQLSVPQRDKLRLVREGVSVMDTREFRVPVDRWFRETGIPPTTRIPLIRTGYYAIDPRQLTQAERTTVDKWYKDHNPIFSKKFFRDVLGVVVPRQDGGVTVDKWFKELERPAKKLTLLDKGSAFQFTPSGEQVTLDKWARELERPQKRFALIDRNGTFQFTPSEVVTLDKWFKENFVPTLLGRKNSVELSRLSFVKREEIFDLSTWLPAFTEITRSAKFRAELLSLISGMEFNTPLIDLDWLLQTNEPIFTHFVKSWLIQQIHLTPDQSLFILRTMCLTTIAVILAMVTNTAEVTPASVTNTADVIPAAVVLAADVIPAAVTNTAEVIPAAVVGSADIVKAVQADVDLAACKDDE